MGIRKQMMNSMERKDKKGECKVKYKKEIYVVSLVDKLKIEWTKLVLLLKRIKRRVFVFIPKNTALYVILTIFWILFGIFSYHVGVRYNAPEPYKVKDVLWELKNSYFTSVVLALLITGYSQNAGYKKRLYVQHNLYVDTMHLFGCIFEQFIGTELYHYMPFYNDKCLRDTWKYIESNPLEQKEFSSEAFKGNLDEVLDGIQKVENEVRNLNVLGMHKEKIEECLQEAKRILKKGIREELELEKAKDVIQKLDHCLFYIVADLRRPWRWDIENDKKILSILARYEQNGIQEDFYYSMHLYGHKFKKKNINKHVSDCIMLAKILEIIKNP